MPDERTDSGERIASTKLFGVLRCNAPASRSQRGDVQFELLAKSYALPVGRRRRATKRTERGNSDRGPAIADAAEILTDHQNIGIAASGKRTATDLA